LTPFPGMSSERSNRSTILLLVVLLAAACLNGHAAEVVYVEMPGRISATHAAIRAAADFYGLNENRILLDDENRQPAVITAISDRKTIALVLCADVLPFLNKQKITAALRRSGGKSIPVLIAGIDGNTAADLLKNWSAGAVSESKTWNLSAEAGYLQIANVATITRELSGAKLPFRQKLVSSMVLNGSKAQPIMFATGGASEVPVFVRVKTGAQDVFFATENVTEEIPRSSSPYRQIPIFTSLAPQMLFLRYAGGDRVWHTPGHFANLTIDDPWLRDPYGFLNYQALLREMEQHNFHTTIAFVPWNFDRSQPAVVSLFRKHGERYSICFHGNNHDHQEFGSYGGKPLNEQIFDIKQGLARMARFQQITQLAYDPVMVFPHSISPEPTLAVLKRYNFWATANSLNVPMGGEPPSETEFALRTATVAFSNFASLRRYSAETSIPESQLAIDAFLGNPMLFYVHQTFFSSGIGAFNRTADVVNRLQPETRWRSLGEIVQHLYLIRARDDGNYDVRAYGKILRLYNRTNQDTNYYVEREEDFAFPVTVYIDGRPVPYEHTGKGMRVQVPMPAGSSRQFEVVYSNDLNLANIDIRKSSPRIWAIRYLSDFRDEFVSKTIWGQRLVRSYSDNGSVWNAAISAAFGVMAVTLAVARRRKRIRSGSGQRSVSEPSIRV
jgi:hypothetical protein